MNTTYTLIKKKKTNTYCSLKVSGDGGLLDSISSIACLNKHTSVRVKLFKNRSTYFVCYNKNNFLCATCILKNMLPFIKT